MGGLRAGGQGVIFWLFRGSADAGSACRRLEARHRVLVCLNCCGLWGQMGDDYTGPVTVAADDGSERVLKDINVWQQSETIMEMVKGKHWRRVQACGRGHEGRGARNFGSRASSRDKGRRGAVACPGLWGWRGRSCDAHGG